MNNLINGSLVNAWMRALICGIRASIGALFQTTATLTITVVHKISSSSCRTSAAACPVMLRISTSSRTGRSQLRISVTLTNAGQGTEQLDERYSPPLDRALLNLFLSCLDLVEVPFQNASEGVRVGVVNNACNDPHTTSVQTVSRASLLSSSGIGINEGGDDGTGPSG